MRKFVERQIDIMLASAGSIYSIGVMDTVLKYVPALLTIIYVVVKIVISIRRESDRRADRRITDKLVRNANREPVKQEETEEDT